MEYPKNKKSVTPLIVIIVILSICIAGHLFTAVPLVYAQSEETTGNFWENPVIRIFSFGCIGAVAPEIVRWYQLLQKGEEIKIPSRFFIVSVVFAILGGVIAIALEAKTLYAAFYNGVSLPSIIKVYAGETIPENPNPSNPRSNLLNPSNSQSNSKKRNNKKREITFKQFLGAFSINSKKDRSTKKEKS